MPQSSTKPDLVKELNAHCDCACRISGPSKSCTKFGSCQLIEKAFARIKELEAEKAATENRIRRAMKFWIDG